MKASKEQNRQSVYQKAAELITKGDLVVLLGTISRTWYEDRDALSYILEWLEALGVKSVAIGPKGWHHVMHGANEQVCSDLPPIPVLDTEAQAAWLVQHSQLVLAFASRVSLNPDDISPLMAVVRQHKIPTLVDFHTGDATFLETPDVASVGSLP